MAIAFRFVSNFTSIFESLSPISRQPFQTASRLLTSKPSTTTTIKTTSSPTSTQANTKIMAKQVVDDEKFTGIRLPTNIKPVHYELSLKPNFKDFTFAGKVNIQFKCQSGDDTPKSVVLHANELKISDGSLQGAAKASPLTVVTYSPKTETATLEFQDGLQSEGTISLNFTGVLGDKMKGFYRTTFKVGDNLIDAATTQFESTDARRCFPCWDEPAFKATFSVSLIIEKFISVGGQQYERLALSNMPEISRSGSDNELEVKFDKSPIMSTYLLAFIIGPFDMVEANDGKRPVRVFTRPGYKEQGRFALEVACKSLQFYENYFGVEYPLPKMDLVAIPDFMSGAMENWGLVTYRETCLLYDSANTTTIRKQYIALVVAHELAHQWFGNLVTMEWWTHLWLNEGFATFMEFLCVDTILPEYDIWSQFINMSYEPALQLDALNNSHPIEVPVNHPSEIEEIFDAISYEKGASIIRMLYTFIGDDNFRKGMKSYLTKFAYKNASTEDLWDSLEAASQKPVRKLMSGWTSLKGYPWLSLDYQESDVAKLTISQSKFTADGTLPKEDSHYLWVTPVNMISKDNLEAREICLLESTSATVSLEKVSDKWIILNPGSIGFYRVAYPSNLRNKLIPAISTKSLSPIDRLKLVSDSSALCEAGNLSSIEVLELLDAFKPEDDYNVWRSIDHSIDRFSTILSDTDYKNKLEMFGRNLFSQIHKSLGWEASSNDKHSAAMHRSLVIRRLFLLQEQAVIDTAKSLFATQVSGGAVISADLRGIVYQAVSVYGDDESFEKLFQIYRETDMSEEKNRILAALGYTKDPERLKRVLAFGLSQEVRKQDIIFLLMSVGSGNPKAGWKFFKENGATLYSILGSSQLMTRCVRSLSENFCTEEMACEVTSFFEANKIPGTERTIKQSVENIRLNAAWLKRDGDKLREFFSKY